MSNLLFDVAKSKKTLNKTDVINLLKSKKGYSEDAAIRMTDILFSLVKGNVQIPGHTRKYKSGKIAQVKPFSQTRTLKAKLAEAKKQGKPTAKIEAQIKEAEGKAPEKLGEVGEKLKSAKLEGAGDEKDYKNLKEIEQYLNDEGKAKLSKLEEKFGKKGGVQQEHLDHFKDFPKGDYLQSHYKELVEKHGVDPDLAFHQARALAGVLGMKESGEKMKEFDKKHPEAEPPLTSPHTPKKAEKKEGKAPSPDKAAEEIDKVTKKDIGKPKDEGFGTPTKEAKAAPPPPKKPGVAEVEKVEKEGAKADKAHKETEKAPKEYPKPKITEGKYGHKVEWPEGTKVDEKGDILPTEKPVSMEMKQEGAKPPVEEPGAAKGEPEWEVSESKAGLHAQEFFTSNGKLDIDKYHSLAQHQPYDANQVTPEESKRMIEILRYGLSKYKEIYVEKPNWGEKAADPHWLAVNKLIGNQEGMRRAIAKRAEGYPAGSKQQRNDLHIALRIQEDLPGKILKAEQAQ